MTKEKIIEVLGSKLIEKVKEMVVEEGENQVEQLWNTKAEESELKRYKDILDEKILEKYGNEIFYDSLCSVLLQNGIIDEIINRCRRRSIFDNETQDEFLERIMKNSKMRSYNEISVREALRYIVNTTFDFFNQLKDTENIILKNILIEEGEKTRKEVVKLRSIISKNNLSETKHMKEEAVFITKGYKNAVRHFQGRINEINEITEIMKNDRESNRRTSLWVYGMGGLGKTQLCRKISSIVKNQYAYIGWVPYMDNFKISLVKSLNICEKSDDLDKEYEKAIQHINSLGSQLLLFIDNYDVMDGYIEDIESLQCHLIVTSRTTNPDTFSPFRLGFLEFSECKALFCFFYTLEDNMIINEIIHKTGYLSLAIELIAKTGEKLGITLEEYLLILEEKGFDLSTVVQSNWDNNGEKLNIELSKHFGIVFDLTTLGQNEEAIYILKNFSILPYLGITRREVLDWLTLDKESGILHDLVDLGWLQLSEREYAMHPVISFTVKQKLKPSLEDCVNLVMALGSCIVVEPGENYLQAFHYLPYAEAVGNYFYKNESILEIEIAALSLLYIRIAEIKRHNGEYDIAYEWGEEAAKCLESINGESGRLKNLVYNIMSEICLDMRDQNEETKEWAIRAIESDCNSEEVSNIEKGTSFHNLAGAYIQMEDNEKALENEMKALELRCMELEEGDIRLVNCYRNIAMIYRRLGNLELALEYHEKVISSLEKIHSDEMNHPDYPVAYNLFSFVLRDLGRIEEAIEYQKKAIRIREYINEEDPKLAINYNNLGMLYLRNNDLEEAMRWEEKAIEMDIKNRGLYHPDLAADYFNYAKILYAVGKKEEAIQYLKQSRDIEEKNGQNPENIGQIDDLLVVYSKESMICTEVGNGLSKDNI